MTKQAAMTEYRAAREYSRKVGEAYLTGKATEAEWLEARRAYRLADKKADEAGA